MIVIPEWAQEISLDEFPERYRQLVQWLGPAKFLELAAMNGGDSFYIPMPDFFLKPLRDRKMIAEYNGSNHRELARKYGLSERQARDICSLAPAIQDENQLKLF